MSSMNDDQLDDLKQFITSTMSQSEQRIKDELRDELGGKIDRLESKVDKVEGKVDEANLKLDTVMSTTGERLEEVETRLTKLEAA